MSYALRIGRDTSPPTRIKIIYYTCMIYNILDYPSWPQQIQQI